MLCIKSCNRLSSLKRFSSQAAENPDIFGSLSRRGENALAVKRVESLLPDDPDGYDKEEFDIKPRKNAYYYKYEISKYARQGSLGLRKALELFHTMKSEDRLTPTVHNFSPLIYGCAKAGHTKKAFELYEESMKYIDSPTNSQITCLINACAESPFPEYGFERLNWFRDHLKINHTCLLNKIHYHSMIKAYGKLGHLEEASKLIQEMLDNDIIPDKDTFNMLLIGCASNEDAGSILALRVYKRMKHYGLKPDIVTYRLILRCIRDCGFGSMQQIKQTFGELPAVTTLDQRIKYKSISSKGKSSESRWKNFEWVPLISDMGASISASLKPNSQDFDGGSDMKLLDDPKNRLDSPDSGFITLSLHDEKFQPVQFGDTTLPNLLSDDHLDLIYRIQAIQFDKLKNAQNRLMLFGGIHGYLETMVKNGCKPDHKTFGLLLSCVKHQKDHEMEYFRLAKDYNIERNLLFYDLLIRHVCDNFHDKTRMKRALFFLEEMQRDNIRPNISTFESLAKGCHSMYDAERLILDLGRCGFTLSDVMIKRFFECAIHKIDYTYLNKLLKWSLDKKYRPVKHLVDALEECRLIGHKIILKHEKGELKKDETPVWLNETQIQSFEKFSKLLGVWLQSVKIKDEEHPWKQFHVETETKRKGFVKFAQEFKILNQVKQEALERGGNLGNLMLKAQKIMKDNKK